MNIQQAMRVGPARVNDLFAKLSETTDGAVKTRETLFAELKSELEQVAEIEERHLLPLLAKHKETKDLVRGAKEDNKTLREQLQALENIPKNDPAFLQAINDLRKGFQRHVRDGKSELLPAVQKALSEEEVQEAAETIQARFEQAEQAKREEEEEARKAARTAREEAKLNAAAQAAAQEAREESARAIRETSRQVVQGLSEGVRRTSETLQSGAVQYIDNAREAAGAFQTLTSFSTATGRAMAEIQAALGERISKSMSETARVSYRLLGCTSPTQIAEIQRDYLQTILRGWVECNERVLQASQRAVDEVAPTLRTGSGTGTERRPVNQARNQERQRAN